MDPARGYYQLILVLSQPARLLIQVFFLSSYYYVIYGCCRQYWNLELQVSTNTKSAFSKDSNDALCQLFNAILKPSYSCQSYTEQYQHNRQDSNSRLLLLLLLLRLLLLLVVIPIVIVIPYYIVNNLYSILNLPCILIGQNKQSRFIIQCYAPIKITGKKTIILS